MQIGTPVVYCKIGSEFGNPPQLYPALCESVDGSGNLTSLLYPGSSAPATQWIGANPTARDDTGQTTNTWAPITITATISIPLT